MLSLFPQLLFLSPFAALFIRIALAVALAYAAWRHAQSRAPLASVWAFGEVALGAAIVLGVYTQGAALLALLGIGIGLFVPRLRVYPLSTSLLMLVMLATLVVTGAGALAFDLPL